MFQKRLPFNEKPAGTSSCQPLRIVMTMKNL